MDCSLLTSYLLRHSNSMSIIRPLSLHFNTRGNRRYYHKYCETNELKIFFQNTYFYMHGCN